MSTSCELSSEVSLINVSTSREYVELFAEVECYNIAIPGSDILFGAGAPAPLLGRNGDVYFNTSNGDVYKKDTTGIWVLQDNVTGPTGPQGPAGTNGTNGTNGATGPQGPAGATHGNYDGGNASSVYGGVTPLDGGDANDI